jgi:flagellar biosynthesis/type III secretory pathway ATPase
MTSFKQYLVSKDQTGRSNELALKNTKNLLESRLAKISILDLSASKKAKFACEVSELSTSEQVLGELSDSIGEPLDNESEEEFVNRAKASLACILRRKLKK